MRSRSLVERKLGKGLVLSDELRDENERVVVFTFDICLSDRCSFWEGHYDEGVLRWDVGGIAIENVKDESFYKF